MSAALALTEFLPSLVALSAVNDNDGQTIYTIYNRAGELVHVDDLTTGTKTDYVRLAGRTVARVEDKITPTYVHGDHLGSPVSRSHASGTLLPRERYTPFGVTLNNPNDLNNQAGFTGHIKDSATGLNYMQARYYDPIIGRFLSIDPMTFTGSGNNPSYFNRYTYTFNDPINATDPTGMYVEFSDRTSEEDLDKFTDYIASSEAATNELNALSSSEIRFTIDISTENQKNTFDLGSRTIRINPNAGTKTDADEIISAASAGIHEMRHARQRIIAGSDTNFARGQRPERSVVDDKGNIIKRGISPNERDATNLQNRVNRQVGEPTRKDYNDGRRVRTCDITSTTQC